MNTNDLWKTILGEIELEIAKPTFKAFFTRTSLTSLKENVATIACANSVISNTIESRYYALIKQKLDRVTQSNCSLLFTLQPQKNAEDVTQTLPLFSSQQYQNKPMHVDSSDLIMRKAHLHPLYTFENFAVSGSNQMAYAAATAVAQNPGKAYNPLFLWGGVGVGKSHLMHAIGHSLLLKNPQTRVVYCMGEEFTNEIIDAIQTKTTKQFKQKYRHLDIFLIDDIQFIAGKNTVQEEFFHTFNAIHQGGGQVVLTSDRPPHEINKLEDRLRSRFEGGLTIDISEPDFELRTAILRIKALQKGFTLPMDVAQLIAVNVSDTRKLEGMLTRIYSEAQMKKLPLSIELVQHVLGKQDEQKKSLKHIPLEDVLKIVSDYYGLKQSQLRSPKRTKTIAEPRQVLMYIMRNELQANLTAIGDILGGRDHTTIMHGVEKITREMLINEKLREDISGIKQRISG